ncbi:MULTISPECIES: SDR family oxidoreductase [Dehalobacter]|uniref:SDR family oxidoreductase n=2 Tax=Dehalobacter restrictus TaxID=55583 RepID=A0A857DGZ3_9FIRM|nr:MULTISPECIES: SDR family oxidoreductase [Dehalobacter]AHF09252.1 short-chain dehydrogenase [Dehalobacter restrictus DSM 9455]MCG1024588.1 SDR family oxidoreductase [Dehalobacter sp.]MDJ0306498.1 SDR family oxidoreductase [Dehalobacter sp.]OCZ50879.1 NAD(P)-dependent oxidoreductase [Dehalobacter sp. TeCB1]QGZ99788.1 SDR family oxidoreductase [Dehalobacter restrictus]
MTEAIIPQPTFPAQHQNFQPGLETLMNPSPAFEDPNYQPGGKLRGKVALISGGDSGIGRAVAILYAKERIEQLGRRCLLIAGDVADEMFCNQAVRETIQTFGHLDILVNNAGEQHPQNSILDITSEQLERTFRTNIFAMFYLTRAALPHLQKGAAVINTASITAYQGEVRLIDYASSKGAVVSFTRSLSESLAKQGIRVNGVAPGPIWTPLIPASFSAEEVRTFGSTNPMQRAGQPVELAPAYLFLASADSAYMSGQILHINGGTIINN